MHEAVEATQDAWDLADTAHTRTLKVARQPIPAQPPFRRRFVGPKVVPERRGGLFFRRIKSY